MGQKKKIESDGRFSRRKETDSKDGTCGFRLVLAAGLCYNPEFDSGILKDAEISASLTIL